MAEYELSLGREKAAAKNWDAALQRFERCIRLCPCSHGAKRPKCACKTISETLTTNPEKLFDELMYKCTCDVGKKFHKCDNQVHLDALTQRILANVALRRPSDIERDAEWLLELAPRSLEGYLRLGKFFWQKRKPKLAWQLYSVGLEVGRKNGLQNTARYKTLMEVRQPLHRNYHRKNPFEMLPLEIITEICTYLSTTDRYKLSLTSKASRKGLTSFPALWKRLHFTSADQVTLATLMRLVSFSSYTCTHLTLGEMPRHNSWHRLYGIFTNSRRLDAIGLPWLSPTKEVDPHFRTGSRQIRNKDDFASALITLVKLRIKVLHLPFFPIEPGLFPQLTRLRLEAHDTDSASGPLPHRRTLSLPSIAAAAPNLVVLHVDARMVTSPWTTTVPFPKLETLICHHTTRASQISGLRPQCRTLRTIHISGRYIGVPFANFETRVEDDQERMEEKRPLLPYVCFSVPGFTGYDNSSTSRDVTVHHTDNTHRQSGGNGYFGYQDETVIRVLQSLHQGALKQLTLSIPCNVTDREYIQNHPFMKSRSDTTPHSSLHTLTLEFQEWTGQHGLPTYRLDYEHVVSLLLTFTGLQVLEVVPIWESSLPIAALLEAVILQHPSLTTICLHATEAQAAARALSEIAKSKKMKFKLLQDYLFPVVNIHEGTDPSYIQN